MGDSHDEISELLGAYALDAVDPDERERVERHLETCPRCRAEVADHREVAAMLAHSGGDAPEGVWGRILESLEEPAPELRLSPVVPPGAEPPSAPEATSSVTDELADRRSRRLVRPLLLGAAAAVLVVVGLVAGVLVADDDPPAPEQAAVSLDVLARETLNDPDARRAALASPVNGEQAATAALDDDGSGYLVGSALPALDESRTYQLWGVKGDDVISLGVLGHSPSVVAFHADPGTEQLVLTEEVAGGVMRSENPALFAGALD